MKKLICSVCISGLALATAALGDNRNHGDTGFAAPIHRGASSTRSAAPAMSQRVTTTPRSSFRQRTYAASPRVRTNYSARSNNVVRSSVGNARVNSEIDASVRRNRSNATVRNNPNAKLRDNVRFNGERNFAGKRNVNVGSNFAVNRNRTSNAIVTNNWRSSQFSGRNYSVFRNYSRQWHTRDWWRRHYNNIVFVDGGWWYWANDYWFPAWGYDPYAYYSYDGPIYGYSNLDPAHVVMNVQAQLARDGYYTGPVDGILGPMTRQAIAAYQADNGLAVTSTVDEPTMESLGLA